MSKTILVEVDHSGVQQSLQKLADALEDTKPVLMGVGELLRNSASDRFKTQTSPDGMPWEPLQHWYKDQKPKNKDKILTLNGYLQSYLAFQVEGDAVLVGSNLEYAAIHQFGGTIRPRDKKALAVGGGLVSSVTIPARPYLGVSNDDAEGIELLVSDYLSSAF